MDGSGGCHTTFSSFLVIVMCVLIFIAARETRKVMRKDRED